MWTKKKLLKDLSQIYLVDEFEEMYNTVRSKFGLHPFRDLLFFTLKCIRKKEKRVRKKDDFSLKLLLDVMSDFDVLAYFFLRGELAFLCQRFRIMNVIGLPSPN